MPGPPPFPMNYDPAHDWNAEVAFLAALLILVVIATC